METQAPEMKMGVETSGERQQEDRASLMENTTSVKDVKTCGKVEKADRASELRELEEHFYALEADRRNLQYLLQEQKEDHAMALRALEREAIQERLEWERQMRKREEALHSAFMSVVISRQKMLKDLKSTTSLMDRTSGTGHIVTSPTVPQGGKNQNGTAVGLDRQRRKWWFLSCCSSHVDSQDSNTSSATADKMADLQLIAKLEERVRKAEAKKQQKALKKAEKKAEKAEKQAEKAEKKAEKQAKKAEKKAEKQAKKAEKKTMKAEKKTAKKEAKKAGKKDEVKENSLKQSLSSATKE
ncbi:calmodulin-regulated spectrin-associated protein 1-B-like [Sardina pilchardus]|uniref:calmodulin-regulated spectrin-associated protein 1-B-like n=1 Tax=Sardina pilchardus TaxID=27697 RepID=UPI002E0DB132